MAETERIIISWLGLRRLIGLIGLLHPFILWFGGLLIFHTQLQDSMSAYYYTPMRDVFVGLGFVTGFFLLCYKGYDTHDRIVSAIAGFAALVVALVPTAPSIDPTAAELKMRSVHMTAAFIFLLALSYFCLVLFPKVGAISPSMNKIKRNKIYRTAGVTILLSLAFAMATFVIKPFGEFVKPYHPIFFTELTAFGAFGIAWLTKGQAILAD